MKIVLVLLLGLTGSIYADPDMVGGNVTPIRKIECTINPYLDLDKDVKNLKLITCMINNNLPDVEFSFKLDLPGVDITSITLHEVDGIRGQGLQLPMDKNLIPDMDGKKYHWVGKQSTATVDYVINIVVDWLVNKTKPSTNPGIYINMDGS